MKKMFPAVPVFLTAFFGVMLIIDNTADIDIYRVVHLFSGSPDSENLHLYFQHDIGTEKTIILAVVFLITVIFMILLSKKYPAFLKAVKRTLFSQVCRFLQ